jgi:hypothetical protein
MKEVWEIPEVASIVNTGTEWLLQLLDDKSETICAKILMTLWRIWHVRNEITHQKPPPPVEASRRFLCSYVQSLAVIRKHPQGDSVKGKMIIEDDVNCLSRMKRKVEAHRPQPKSWTKPPRGWTKLNVDGSFVEDTGESGAGMVLRTDDGTIVFSACRYLGRSSTPLATELAACMEGIALSRQ